jgi:hypothetical protein
LIVRHVRAPVPAVQSAFTVTIAALAVVVVRARDGAAAEPVVFDTAPTPP